MDPVTIGLALAQFAPSIIKYFTGSDKASTVAQQVIGIAQTVTGATTSIAALATIQADPDKAMAFQQAIMQIEADLDKAYLLDIQNARNRDVSLAQAGIHNYRANILVTAAILMVIACLLLVVWNSTMDEYVKATISLILGRALGWVEQIFSFEFGTTRANKTKDDTINNLTK